MRRGIGQEHSLICFESRSANIPPFLCPWCTCASLSPGCCTSCAFYLFYTKEAHPNAKIVVGNSEVQIEYKFKHMRYPVLVSPVLVPELNKVSLDVLHHIPA